MGNDMFNDEQLKYAEIVQKETEDALGFWKDRALKAEAERDALLSRPAARVTFICPRCGRNGDYHGEPGGDRCGCCGGNGPVCPAPAPSAKETQP